MCLSLRTQPRACFSIGHYMRTLNPLDQAHYLRQVVLRAFRATLQFARQGQNSLKLLLFVQGSPCSSMCCPWAAVAPGCSCPSVGSPWVAVPQEFLYQTHLRRSNPCSADCHNSGSQQVPPCCSPQPSAGWSQL